MHGPAWAVWVVCCMRPGTSLTHSAQALAMLPMPCASAHYMSRPVATSRQLCLSALPSFSMGGAPIRSDKSLKFKQDVPSPLLFVLLMGGRAQTALLLPPPLLPPPPMSLLARAVPVLLWAMFALTITSSLVLTQAFAGRSHQGPPASAGTSQKSAVRLGWLSACLSPGRHRN